MNKVLTHKRMNGEKRVLATKKASPAIVKMLSLKFKQVDEVELKATRNPAYTYMIK